MAKCAFGRVLLRGIFEAQYPFGTELYARLAYIENDSTQVLLMALDTLATAQQDTARLRDLVSQKTGIPTDNIWYHELQVHAAPSSKEMESAIAPLAQRIAEETLRMISRAVPFTCQVAECDMGTRFSMNREQYIEGLGGVTVWAGIRFDEDGKPYCNDPSRMLLHTYKPDLPVFEKPIYFDNTVDSKAYLFVFRDAEDRVIGTLSRFAAHPDVAVLFESYGVHEYHYHFDWPGHLSEKLEAYFGAPSMYMNGPCGDLATRKAWDNMDTYEASAAECKRIGEAIADELIRRFETRTVSLGNTDHLRAGLFTVEVPMNDVFPHSLYDDTLPARTREAGDALRKAMAEDAPAYHVKRLLDDRIRVSHMPYILQQEPMFTEEDLNRHTVFITISVLQLGEYLFIGVPGESLVDMTMWLRSSFTGVKTIPVDQVNGYFSYMATPRSLTLGGYTYWASWVSRESDGILKAGIVKAMDQWLTE